MTNKSEVWRKKMKRDDVVAVAKAKLREIGIPPHICWVRRIPARTEVHLLIGTEVKQVVLRSGITPGELAEKLGDLETSWRNRDGVGGEQSDLEEAIEQAT